MGVWVNIQEQLYKTLDISESSIGEFGFIYKSNTGLDLSESSIQDGR